MSHHNHHFVPAFLLREWESGKPAKLTYFMWAQDKLVQKPRTAGAVASQRFLYSINVDPTTNSANSRLEIDFMGPVVDDPASVVHKAMLKARRGKTEWLSDQQREIWARFIVAQMVRIPAHVEMMRKKGGEILRANTKLVSVEGFGDGVTPQPINEWLEQYFPDSFDDLGVLTLPSVVNSERLNALVLGTTWELRDIRHTNFDLLISDSPLTYFRDKGHIVFVLPIAPHRLFFAYSNLVSWAKIRRFTMLSLAKRSNVSQVEQAERYVYSTSSAQKPLVEKYLRKPRQLRPQDEINGF